MTKVSQNGEKWLKDNLDIELDKILMTEDKQKTFDTTKFFNDMNKTKSIHKSKLLDLELDFKTLESMYFNKGIILSEMKLKVNEFINKDNKNRRILSTSEILDVFSKLKLSNELSSVKVKEIIEIYYDENPSSLDYFEFIDKIVKDIRSIINLI